MYVVFYSYYEGTDLKSDYFIEETEQEAVYTYKAVLRDENLYCAGWAPIKAGTEPHWVDND